ncbi:HD-GYP domain-containing protein [Clostridium sp. D2Q-11]|uniref:HD-GYP domain-containing protein n=1 Tax=Anaeromonas frigoriresistens TaxID=2683708 RepID=A0A942Z866_9FIRM|nr:HD-GYP domain-containing protein [Anaeromonas frigoriresistens]MBS4537620.1 HD-GYP domain-containing protein [Anaeromonas frigoriresistens]
MTVRKLINTSLSIIFIITFIIITSTYRMSINSRREVMDANTYCIMAIIFFIFFIIIFILINYLLNERLLKPLEELNQFASSIEKDNFQSYEFKNLINNKGEVKELQNFKGKFYVLLENLRINEEEITAQNEMLDKSNKEVKVLSNRLEEIMDSFIEVYKLRKDEFIKRSFESIFTLIEEADKGTLFELRDEYYYPIESKGYNVDILNKLKFKKGETFIDAKDVDSKKVNSYIDHLTKDSNKALPETTIELLNELGTNTEFDTLYAPIISEGNIIGMISLDSFSLPTFSEDSRKILRYYAQLISEFYSQAIQKDKLHNTYLETVKALVSAIELKDKYTKGHGDRVREYSIEIAKACGLEEEKIKNIDIAALLHDVGKIGIPGKILNKPDKLNYIEYEVIKKHPEFSKQIIEKISGLSHIVDVIHLHHEHYDGNGYPFGLKESEIPIESQIIQLADAFDAMTSDRSYRKAMNKEKAINIIKSESGKQFHPVVSDIAIKEVFNKI